MAPTSRRGRSYSSLVPTVRYTYCIHYAVAAARKMNNVRRTGLICPDRPAMLLVLVAKDYA